MASRQFRIFDILFLMIYFASRFFYELRVANLVKYNMATTFLNRMGQVGYSTALKGFRTQLLENY